jgi:hypothetical protein
MLSFVTLIQHFWGVSYLIVAVCDQDCRDMDLCLFDENRNLISEDITKILPLEFERS